MSFSGHRNQLSYNGVPPCAFHIRYSLHLIDIYEVYECYAHRNQCFCAGMSLVEQIRIGFIQINLLTTLESWKGAAFSCIHFFLKVQISDTVYVKVTYLSMLQPAKRKNALKFCMWVPESMWHSVTVILNLGVLRRGQRAEGRGRGRERTRWHRMYPITLPHAQAKLAL